MFNTLTCKVRFHIAVWILSKSIRASSFIENFPQISAKPIGFQRNLLGKLSQNRPFFTNCFSAKLASKIPAKFPRNRPFFPRICPRKSREIWLFFRDLPEALSWATAFTLTVSLSTQVIKWVPASLTLVRGGGGIPGKDLQCTSLSVDEQIFLAASMSCKS